MGASIAHNNLSGERWDNKLTSYPVKLIWKWAAMLSQKP